MKCARALGTLMVALAASCVIHVHDGRYDPDEAAVRRVVSKIIAADNARDIDRVLECYASDAILMPQDEPLVSGIDEIRPRYERLFELYDPAITTEVQQVTVSDDFAYVRGRNAGSLRGRDGAANKELDDPFLMLLHRDDYGRWRISHLMWHRGSH